jgi:hypothetical protein
MPRTFASSETAIKVAPSRVSTKENMPVRNPTTPPSALHITTPRLLERSCPIRAAISSGRWLMRPAWCSSASPVRKYRSTLCPSAAGH